MRLAFTALVIFFVSTLSSVSADVAYSNFGANDSHSDLSTGFGNISSINSESTNYHLARSFTSEATGLLSSIEIPLAIFPNLPNSGDGNVSISLWSHVPNANAGLPDVKLWTSDPVFVDNVRPEFEIYEIAANSGQPMLNTGTDYWVVASSADGMLPFLWAQNDDPFRIGGFGFSHSSDIEWLGESITTESAFRVNVATAVPEPSGCVPLAIMALLFCKRNRSNKHVS